MIASVLSELYHTNQRGRHPAAAEGFAKEQLTS